MTWYVINLHTYNTGNTALMQRNFGNCGIFVFYKKVQKTPVCVHKKSNNLSIKKERSFAANDSIRCFLKLSYIWTQIRLFQVTREQEKKTTIIKIKKKYEEMTGF